MYGDEEDQSSRMRERLLEELDRVKQQSRVALEQTWARVEQLQREEEEMSEALARKEEQLHAIKTAKSMSSVPNDSPKFSRRNSAASRRNSSNSAASAGSRGDIDTSAVSQRRRSNPNPGDEDVRIHLMRQEREDKVREIEELIYDYEIQLQSLQEETVEQQETIQELQRELEELQGQSRPIDLHEKVDDKARYAEELEEELDALHAELSESQRDHLDLEEEWNDREDLVAEAETKSMDELQKMQQELEKYTQETQIRDSTKSEMMQYASESFEEIRQDLMENHGPDTSHNLVLQLRKDFDTLQEKEDELAHVLVDRLEERNGLLPLVDALKKSNRDASKVLAKIIEVKELFEAKTRYAQEDLSEYTRNQINSVQEHIVSSFEEILEVLGSCQDNLEGSVEQESSDEHIVALSQSVDTLNYTIHARFRQILRVLPDPTDNPAKNVDSVDLDVSLGDTRIHTLQEALGRKETELKDLEGELAKMEESVSEEFSKAKKKADLYEREVDSLANDLKEKDKIIDAIRAIIRERKNSESLLFEELEFVYRNGIINDETFEEEKDRPLLEILRQGH
jgi:predicted  nucleic acid-binding Zn-ribbon protein